MWFRVYSSDIILWDLESRCEVEYIFGVFVVVGVKFSCGSIWFFGVELGVLRLDVIFLRVKW